MGVLPGIGSMLMAQLKAPFELLAAADKGNTGGSSTHTIAGIDFGAGGHIAIALGHGDSNGNNYSISSMTINGVAATAHARGTGGSNTAIDTGVFSAIGVPGGVGDIVITLSNSRDFSAVYGVWRVGGAVHDTAEINDSATSASVALDVVRGGAILAAHTCNAGGDTSSFNAGVDQVHSGSVNVSGTGRPCIIGARLATATDANVTVSTTTGSNHTRRLAAASFQP